MLQDFVKEYMGLNSIDEILNVNKENLNVNSQVLYDSIYNYSIDSENFFYLFATIFNEYTKLNLTLNKETRTTKDDFTIESLVLTDNSNIKITLVESCENKVLNSTFNVVNDELWDSFTLKEINNIEFSDVLKAVFYQTLFSYLTMHEKEIIDSFKSFYINNEATYLAIINECNSTIISLDEKKKSIQKEVIDANEKNRNIDGINRNINNLLKSTINTGEITDQAFINDREKIFAKAKNEYLNTTISNINGYMAYINEYIGKTVYKLESMRVELNKINRLFNEHTLSLKK